MTAELAQAATFLQLNSSVTDPILLVLQTTACPGQQSQILLYWNRVIGSTVMVEKAPHTRTDLSLCGLVIFKSKINPGTMRSPKKLLSKLGISKKGSKAALGQRPNEPSHPTFSPEDPFVDRKEKYPVEAVLHEYLQLETPFL